MSRSSWTWHNLSNLIVTINFKYKYFHNSVDWSRFYLQVYIPSWLEKFQDLYTVFRLQKNVFGKLLFPWHYLIINSTCRTAPQNLSPSLHEKFLEKGPSILFGGRHYALTPLENHVRDICSLNICKEVWTKTC